MSRLAACLILALALPVHAGPKPGSERQPFASAANPAEPRDNADGWVTDAGRWLMDGGNRLYVQGPAGEPLRIYVDRGDGTGWHFYPNPRQVRFLGRGEYRVAASLSGPIFYPGRRPHFDYGPLTLRFRSRAGHRAYWRLLPAD